MASNRTRAAAPRVSVIIPAYNRREELEKLLEAMQTQTMSRHDYEIIIVDDGSTDGTHAFLEQAARHSTLDIRFAVQNNKGPGAARNRGIEMARAPVFAFTDTDCIPLPEWLARLTAPFHDPDVGAVGGPELPQPGISCTGKAIDYCMTSAFTTGGLRGRGGKTLARYYPRTFNMAISRKAAMQAGGFQPLYHGEDVELSCRIKKAGFHLRFAEGAAVYHNRRTSLGSFFMQVFRMGQARVTLFRMHPELLEPLHVLPAAGILGFLGLLVLCLLSLLPPAVLPGFFCAAGAVLLALGCVAVIRQGSAGLAVLVPTAFVLQQLAYGLGFLLGLRQYFSKKQNGSAPCRLQ